MLFKYSQYPASNQPGDFIYRPTVDIIFKYNQQFILVEALVDSGSDWTILPLEVADVLGIPVTSNNKTEFNAAGGNTFMVYQPPYMIEHILRQPGFRPFKWKSKVCFAVSQPTILLGQVGFLDRFKVTLNGIKKQLEISK